MDFHDANVTTTLVITTVVASVLITSISSFKQCVPHVPPLAGSFNKVSEPQCKRKGEGCLCSMSAAASNRFLANYSCQSLDDGTGRVLQPGYNFKALSCAPTYLNPPVVPTEYLPAE